MESVRVNEGKIWREKLKKVAFKGRNECLMRKALELSILCGNNVCIILYTSKQSARAETWPSDTAKLISVINDYNNDIARRRNNHKNINFTLSDLKLGYNRWAVNNIWEKELPCGFMELPFQKLAVISEKIDATLRKIDGLMLQASARSCRIQVPWELMQQDNPVYLKQHGFGADEYGNQFQINNTWYRSVDPKQVDVSKKRELVESSAVSNEAFNQQLLLIANPFHQSPYGTLCNDFSSLNTFDNIDLSQNVNPSSDQVHCDWYPERMVMDSDGAYYNPAFTAFNTTMDTEFMFM